VDSGIPEFASLKRNRQEAPEFNSDIYRTSNRQNKTYAGNLSSSRYGETKSRRLYNIELLKDGECEPYGSVNPITV
jgi:hypothetical protein